MIKNLHIFSIILTVLLFDFLSSFKCKTKKLRIVDGDTIYLEMLNIDFMELMLLKPNKNAKEKQRLLLQ